VRCTRAPDVIEAARFSVPDPRLGEVVGRLVQTPRWQAVDAERDMAADLDGRLAKFKILRKTVVARYGSFDARGAPTKLPPCDPRGAVWNIRPTIGRKKRKTIEHPNATQKLGGLYWCCRQSAWRSRTFAANTNSREINLLGIIGAGTDGRRHRDELCHRRHAPVTIVETPHKKPGARVVRFVARQLLRSSDKGRFPQTEVGSPDGPFRRQLELAAWRTADLVDRAVFERPWS